MNIACPKCETTFTLPDELYRPGKKARCSQCGNVFAMPDLSAPPERVERAERMDRADPAQGVGDVAPSLPPAAPLLHTEKKKFPVLLAGILVLCCLGLGFGGYLLYRSLQTPATAESSARLTDEQKRRQEELAVLAKDIEVDNIRQFVDSNDAIGGIVVIMGVAVNTADPPKDLITLEGRLLDKNRNMLASETQVCGVTLPTYQLKTLPAKQLKELLNNRSTILLNNTNVPKGGRVPFMFVFPAVPPAMELFTIDVVGVQKSPPPANQDAASRP